jgi:hypothetical protein
MREVLPHPPVRNCRNSLGGWLSQTVTCMPRTPSRTDLKTGDGPMHMVRYMFRKGSQPCTLFSECRGLEILPSFPAVKSARGNWSGHFCAQFAACGILPAFSLPLTFWLSLPRTTSGNIDDEVRQEPVEQRAGRIVGWPMARRILDQARICLESVVIAGVGRKDPAQMSVAKDDDVIEAFPADRADQSLRMPILPG